MLLFDILLSKAYGINLNVKKIAFLIKIVDIILSNISKQALYQIKILFLFSYLRIVNSYNFLAE